MKYTNEDSEKWEQFEKLVELRVEFAFNSLLEGLNIDYDSALDYIRNFNDDMSKHDKDLRDRIVAAIDNIIDFATAEELCLVDEVGDYDEEDDYNKYIQECEDDCKKYNLAYASVENDDVKYAAILASKWINISEDTYLTYMTMGDERVRPWHLVLEGTTYKKENFPAWLIPPIEHGCRCYLVISSDTLSSSKPNKVLAKMNNKMPDFVDPTFKDSLCVCGKIFSEDHRYFKIIEKYNDVYNMIRTNIKNKYFNG